MVHIFTVCGEGYCIAIINFPVFDANYRLVATSKVENMIIGCLLDSQGVLATMYVSDKYKEQRRAAGIESKYHKIIVYNLLFVPYMKG